VQDEQGGGLRTVVLDLSAVPTIDGTVVHEFRNLFREHQRRCAVNPLFMY
jgi:anti-anti-sigma regulatory factor